MSFQKLESESFCVGGRHRSAIINIFGDITSKGSKVLIGYCSLCNRKKSFTFSDNTAQAKGLGSSFKILRRILARTGKKFATNILKYPGGALELNSNIATSVATKSPKAVLSSLPEVINFYHTGKGLYLGKFVSFC